jgi:hypothetical protein
MTSLIVVVLAGFLLLAQVVTLPNWLLFSVSLALITLFVVYGKDRTNVRNH